MQEKRHSPPAKLRFALGWFFFVADLADPFDYEVGASEGLRVVLQRPVKVDEGHRQTVALGAEVVPVRLKIRLTNHEGTVRLPRPNLPAVLIGWVIAMQRRPPRSSTRAASRTTPSKSPAFISIIPLLMGRSIPQ